MEPKPANDSAKSPPSKNNRLQWPLTVQQRVLAGSLAAMAGLLALSGLFSAEFLFLGCLVVLLAGLTAYDILGRKNWERNITDQIRMIKRNYAELLRRVSRDDVSVVPNKAVTPSAQAATAKEIEDREFQILVEKLNEQKPESEKKPKKTQEEKRAPASVRQPVKYETLEKNEFSDTVTLELLRSAIRQKSMDTYMQPIVRLPGRGHVFYELFSRLKARPGVHLSATHYLKVAEEASLVTAIDNLLMLRCLRMIQNTTNSSANGPSYFLNISSNSLNDKVFINNLLSFLSREHKLAKRVIFEMKQEDLLTLNGKSGAILDGLAKLGCRLSMDTVTRSNINVTALKRHHVAFVKLDSKWILNQASGRDGIARVRALISGIKKNGINVIVDKVEQERDLRELMHYGIAFGQGYLFGRPKFFGNLEKKKSRQVA